MSKNLQIRTRAPFFGIRCVGGIIILSIMSAYDTYDYEYPEPWQMIPPDYHQTEDDR